MRLLALLALFKGLYLTGVVAAVSLWGELDTRQFYAAFQRWPREGDPIFASHFATWDTAHYLYLSEIGYSSGARACAFYPLWPLLVRWTSHLLAGNLVLAGLLLSNICSLAAWALFHHQVYRQWGDKAADWALILLIAFPGSLFFQFNYTESLFLLLLMILWWAIGQRRFGWAWMVGCLLPLTRPIGVFMVLPIAAELLLRRKRQPEPQSCEPARLVARTGPDVAGYRRLVIGKPIPPPERPESPPPPRLGNRFSALFTGVKTSHLWLLAAPLIGWGLYLTLMWSWTGNPFEGFSAQKYWGVHSISNLWNVPKLVVRFLTVTAWHEYGSSVLERCIFILLLYSLLAVWRLNRRALVWTYVLAIIPAMSGSFISFTRYMSCAFPVFIGLGVFLAAREWRWLRYSLLGLFTVLHVVLVWRFVNFKWAG